jgi:DNA modification methylase
MLNAIGAPLRQDAAKLIQAGFSVSPIALLERVVKASSRPGDLILDPFCGCGTAVHAVQNLDRSWIGRTLRGILAKIRPEPVREPLPPPKV